MNLIFGHPIYRDLLNGKSINMKVLFKVLLFEYCSIDLLFLFRLFKLKIYTLYNRTLSSIVNFNCFKIQL